MDDARHHPSEARHVMTQPTRPANGSPQTGPIRHQTRLVNVVLVLMSGYFAVIATLNVLVFQDYGLAVLDLAGMTGCLATLWYFRRTGGLQIASRIVVGLLTVVILLFIHVADGRSYSLIWVTILPPIAFFLLGRTVGAWLCGLVFLYVAGFVYLRLPEWQPVEPGLGTLLNLIEVLTAHWFLFRLYERSRAEAFAELEHLSETDTLTGLLNRNRLDSLLQQELERHGRTDQPLSLVLCDVDHFKRINDEHGHLTGDRVLRDIAHHLRDHIRSVDQCGRWGGEEFLIICPDTSGEAAAGMIERLRKAARDRSASHAIPFTLSFGIATLYPAETSEQLLRRADRALYEAKRAGRDRVELAS